MINKDSVKNLYLKGYNAVQIANILGYSIESTRKCIQRNFKELKQKNQISKIYDKEVKRISNHEAKAFMSDRDFIKRNRSIYRTKDNGDIVLRKDVAGVIPWDVPRRLTNENKCVI